MRHQIGLTTIVILFLCSACSTTPEPITWSKLETIMSDSLLSATELGLAENCSQKPYRIYRHQHGAPLQTYQQEILYSLFRWEEHQFEEGICIYVHDSFFVTGNQPICGDRYLTTNEARTLLSASQASGLEEKGYIDLYQKCYPFECQLDIQADISISHEELEQLKAPALHTKPLVIKVISYLPTIGGGLCQGALKTCSPSKTKAIIDSHDNTTCQNGLLPPKPLL